MISSSDVPQRNIPCENSIKMFFHCAKCMKKKPINKSPREWSMLEVAFTEIGIQVWCKRCECNIVHVDFEGQKHPTNQFRSPQEEQEYLRMNQGG